MSSVGLRRLAVSLRGSLRLFTSKAAPKEHFRRDYAPPPYRISSVSLDVNIAEHETLVTSTLRVSPSDSAAGTLRLDGEDLSLRSILLDGIALEGGVDYDLSDGLALRRLPDRPFELRTVVAIEPQKNTQLSGLYKSSGIFCTQCEAEGFRRITYFQDRPDVLATYDVRIEAERARYPVLLSNGNEVDKGDAPDGRHWASFADPFPKPSYLFAAVAGELGGIEDQFVTASGRSVRLALWSEHENVDQLDWAMQSLKDAMAWDERTYGLEYDLDVYHIVAVNDFNMGAMENKGLNVFNTAAVLAKPSTATDADYERVQGIVAHEYFHNWSGNRVTCRDWFQLTLKEGLTVFRDQHFSQEMTSAAVRRIEEARTIRSAQFVQDAGPMAHPIRPESYVAMDNFYTVTVYNKGAEVIRMYRTLLGWPTFRKAMGLYFERHDGQAVTCDDFRQAMIDASGRDLTQFENWYLQAGTPTVTAEGRYDAAAQSYSLTLSQATPGTPGQPAEEKRPFHIPVEVGLLGKDGTVLSESTLELTEPLQTFTWEGIPEEPLPSLLRGFSAPVKLKTNISPQQLAFLAANDSDPFNRWDSLQQLYTKALLSLLTTWQASGGDKAALSLDQSVSEAFGASLSDLALDPSLRAYSITMPDFSALAQEVEVIDADAIVGSLKFMRRALAAEHRSTLLDVYHSLASDAPYAVDEAQVGARRLRNACLGYLVKLGADDTTDLARRQFQSATCMTDSIAALSALAALPGAARDESMATFIARAQANKETLVINKWLAVQAAADVPDAVGAVRSLMSHDAYDGGNPNAIRSLLSTFAMANPGSFHKKDGSGYAFIAQQVIELDRRNPQVAARLASSFNMWRRHDPARQDLMRAQLELIAAGATSNDTKEIVGRALAY